MTTIYPNKITKICTLYDFIDGKKIFSKLYEGEFLEHKKGERINLREDGENQNEGGESLEDTKVRAGDYKVIEISYRLESWNIDKGRLRKDYTLKRVKKTLLSKLVDKVRSNKGDQVHNGDE